MSDKPIRMDPPQPGEDPEEIAQVEAMVSQAAELAVRLEYGETQAFWGRALGPSAKGHVPEENLAKYRRLKQVAETFGSLGSRVSGIGQYEDANLCFQLEARYQALANTLRADLPRKEEGHA